MIPKYCFHDHYFLNFRSHSLSIEVNPQWCDEMLFMSNFPFGSKGLGRSCWCLVACWALACLLCACARRTAAWSGATSWINSHRQVETSVNNPRQLRSIPNGAMRCCLWVTFHLEAKVWAGSMPCRSELSCAPVCSCRRIVLDWSNFLDKFS